MKMNNTESMITAFESVHGNTYDYSESIFVDYKTKIKIRCRKHGFFTQSHYNHIRGAGCKLCGINRAHIGKKKSTSEFINESIRKYGYEYDYSKVDYVNVKTPVIITCNKHGDFKMRANYHLNGRGCPKCGNERTGLKLLLTNDEFILKSKHKHKERYDYSLVDYSGCYNKVCIICPDHGEFWQLPSVHLSGCGCPKCGEDRRGFGKSNYIRQANGKMATLYKIKCYNEFESFYKIGRTFIGLKNRYRCNNDMPYNYRIISELIGDAGYIYDLENKEKRRHNHLKYKPSISFRGETECFTKII